MQPMFYPVTFLGQKCCFSPIAPHFMIFIYHLLTRSYGKSKAPESAPPTAPGYTCLGSKLISCSQFSSQTSTAVITDGARGLGLAFTQIPAKYGANLVVLDITQLAAALERTKSDYGVKIECCMVYIANREQVIQVIEEIQNNLAL